MNFVDIMAAVVQWPEVAAPLADTLTNDLVTASPSHLRIATFLRDFLGEHGSMPKQGDWQLWLETVPDQHQKATRQNLRQLLDRDLSQYTPSHVLDHAEDQLKATAAQNATARLQQARDEAQMGQAFREMAQQVDSIEALSVKGLADLREVDRYARPPRAEDTISTGIKSLDRRIQGWGRELAMVMADSGVGKSISLANFGAVAAQQGAKVLHITLEIDLMRQAARYYRRMVEADQATFRSKPTKVRRDAQHWWKFARGELFLLYRDAYSVTPEQLLRIAQTVERMKGTPDVVIVDYLDLLQPSPEVARERTYEQLGHATHYLRRFCEEFECSVLTATQAQRPKGSKGYIEWLSLANMGDSYKKVRAADVVLGLVQTPEEKDIYQARIQVLKVRDAPGQGAVVPVFFYRDLMLLADVEHPNVQRLREEHGLPPANPEIHLEP